MKLTKKEKKVQEQKTEKDYLKRIVKTNTTLIIFIKSVSQSGMSRKMAVYITDKKTGRLLNLTYSVAKLIDYKYNDNNSITVSGCGMDMAFWLAYRITSELYPKQAKKETLNGNGGNTLDWQAIY